MKMILRFILMVMSLVLLSGCWDSKDIQDIQYISAMGIDYQNGQYVVYVQVTSFAGVAKQEGLEPKPTPVWVAKGQGETLQVAMNDIYKRANQYIYWAHVKLIIFSESILKHGLDNINDPILRFQQIRETTWLYGTDDSLEKILFVNSLFGSSVQTSIFNPNDIYKLRSYVEPIRIHRFYTQNYETGMTIKLPKISLKTEVWKFKEKSQDTVKLSGAYFIKNNQLKGEIGNKHLGGLRWLTKSTVRSPVAIKINKNIDVELSLYRPKFKIKPIYVNDKVEFDISIEVDGAVMDMEGNIPFTQLREKTERALEKEIRDTYKYALEKNLDIYNLEGVIYRKDLKKWKEIHKKDFNLNEDSIRNIQVEVTIQKTGDYKYEYMN
ncbi:Ger(x)C family spore germination protein [Peribacillus sp. NPDC006672]|uniref:Ger(x)C family spore germination protein n=1 Tax=Peribacillus sp. NPDC006672 TaxID=3390606 RepID=UPI003CFF0BDA